MELKPTENLHQHERKHSWLTLGKCVKIRSLWKQVSVKQFKNYAEVLDFF